MDTDKVAVLIIANSGDSRSASMEAIEAARSGNFEEAERLLNKSSEALQKAHEMHTHLMVQEGRNGKMGLTMILVHASNHFSIAEINRDLAEQFVNLYREVKKNE